jgi:hypothetical protein
MNKSKKQVRHERRRRLAIKKRAERDTNKLEREIEKIQNKNTHIVREDSENERIRIARSMLPKEKIEITNIQSYRQERRKRIKGVK